MGRNFGLIHAAVGDDRIVDMNADDLAEHDPVAESPRIVGQQFDDLVEPAFEVDRRALDPGRTHQPGRLGFEPGQRELIDAAQHVARRDPHRLALLPGREAGDEFACLLHVVQAVLGAALGVRAARRVHHLRRVIAAGVEVTEGREVEQAGVVERGDPADRSRHHAGLEGVVRQAVIVARGFVEHSPATTPSASE